MNYLLPFLAWMLVSSVAPGQGSQRKELYGGWIVIKVQNPFESVAGSMPYQLTAFDFRETTLYQVHTQGVTPASYRLGEEEGLKTIDITVPTVGVALGIYSLQGDRLYLGIGRAGIRPKSFKFERDNMIVQISLIRDKGEPAPR